MTRTWKDVGVSLPTESDRYWCYVAEQTDLGLSHYEWNVFYNVEDNLWVKNSGDAVTVTHWTELMGPPSLVEEKEFKWADQKADRPEKESTGWGRQGAKERGTMRVGMFGKKLKNVASDFDIPMSS